MIHAARNVVHHAPIIDAEAIDLDAGTKGEARQTAEIFDGEFFAKEVIVAKAQPEVFLPPEKELAVENEVPEEVVEKDLGIAVLRWRFAEEQRLILAIGIVVGDVPLLHIVINDGKAKRQVAQSLGNADLNFERQRFEVVVAVGGELRADIFEQNRCIEAARRIEIHRRQVGRKACRIKAAELGRNKFHIRAKRQAFVHLLACSERYRVLRSFEVAGHGIEYIALVELTVVDVLHPSVESRFQLWEIIGVSRVAVLDVAKVKIVAE